MRRQPSKIVLATTLRPKFALGLLFAALMSASTAAFAKLEPKTVQLLTMVGAEIPSGILGSKMSERYFRGIIGIGYDMDERFRAMVERRCEEFLYSMDPAGTIDREGPLDVIRHALVEVYARDRLKAPRTSVQDFDLATSAHRAHILKNFLENLYDVPELVGNVDQVPRVFDELLGIPYDRIEQSLDGTRFDGQWSAANTGPELNTSPFDAMAIQDRLGPLKGKMIDVGSGFGVPGLIFSLFNPDLQYVGLELVPEKIAAAKELGRRFGVTSTQFQQTDLSAPGYRLPDADYYYMFNPVTRDITNALFQQLDMLAGGKKLRLILNSSWGDTRLFKNLELERIVRSVNGRELFVYVSRSNSVNK